MGLLLGSLVAVAGFPAVAYGAEPFNVDVTQSSSVRLGSIAQVRRVGSNERWRNSTDHISIGFGAGPHELTFQYQVAEQGLDTNWLLDLGSGSIRHIRLEHWIDAVRVADYQTGTGYPASTRALDYYRFVFPLAMRVGEHRLRVVVDSHSSVYIEPSLNQPMEWFSASGSNQWLVGGLMGTFVMLAFYNLVVFGVTRERIFLLFSISCIALALWRACDLGLGAQFLYPNMPELQEPISRLSVALYTSFLLLFCREYFGVKEFAPKLAQWSLYAVAFVLLTMLLPVFRYAPAVGFLSLFICPTLSIAMIVRAKLQKIPGSNIFLLGVALLLFGGVVTVARMLGWIAPEFELRFASELSIILVTILTSIALASRLTQEKLRRELAVAATKAKSLFLANMSHELRTPLNAIVGFSDLLHDSDLADEHKGFARRIDSASKSLLGTIDDLLDYSKLEAGQLVVEREPVDMKLLLDNVHGLFERRAVESGLTFERRIEGSVPQFFLGDALRLTQILTNLVSNALKFTSQGEVLIRVLPSENAAAKANAPTTNQWVWFEVRDTGIGLTQEQQEMLFVPFAQADASTTRRFGGTGLGLSICKELVERMGGEMSIRSRPGVGSCFRFSLCLEICATASVSRISTVGPEADLSSFKVLVVEDNQTNQLLIRAMLKKSNVQFQLVENGAQALEYLRRFRVDVVLMDCQMPVMDGYAATRAIREELGLRHLPIVALTANASPEDRTRCLGVGMNDFLTKPIRYQQLLGVLHKWTPDLPPSRLQKQDQEATSSLLDSS